MGKILIEQIAVNAIIGVYDQERIQKQPLLIDIEMHYDASQASASDKIEYALDYHKICSDIHAYVESSKFQLLEALADSIASRILKEQRVTSVRVSVSKPNALVQAKTVYFELTKLQKNS